MDKPTFDLEDRTALVTGASRGIGRGIVDAYVAAGANVMLVARKQVDLDAVAAELPAEQVATFAGNVGDPEAASAAVEATITRFGALDILVNNAATNPYMGPTIDVDLPRLDKTIQVNLRGPLVWTQAAWRLWMADHGGVVINVSSIGGIHGSGTIGVYDMTKAGLNHLTRILAAELGPKVRVNGIAPGLVRTQFAQALWENGRDEAAAKTFPLKRVGEVHDLASAALFLGSDHAAWITGHILVVDGGTLVRVLEREPAG
jgi:NAD(P)-dependent dehydrogenase (short-subunit alcohol dehydrogenase family)